MKQVQVTYVCDAQPWCDEESAPASSTAGAKRFAKEAGWLLDAYGHKDHDLCPAHAHLGQALAYDLKERT